MNPITAPLRQGDQGTAVANLQAGLTLLLAMQVIQAEPDLRAELLNALAEESREQSYNDATEKSVAIFQEQRDIRQNGAVDAQTAAALNEALRSLGAFGNGQEAPPLRTVAGQVAWADRTPFASQVILFEENAAGSLHLGEDSTDPEGRYTITYALPDGMDGTSLRVAAFDGDGQHRAEETFQATTPVQIVDLVVEGNPNAYRVTGRLSSDVRAGVGGLRIVIVDKNVGGDATVAETTTGPDGAYRIAFVYAGEKAKPDLQVRAFSGQTLLGASDVRYNAANDETLHISVSGDAQAVLATEHETLTEDIAAHYIGSLRDLQETADRRDVTYLANKTGWDARAVALASLADQFSARTFDSAGAPAIHAALFYVLFRAGLPANDAAIYRTDAGNVGAIWQQGVDQGIVPAHLADGIPAALDVFRTLSAKQALSGPAIAGRSSLAEMLTVSLPDADAAQQEQFARLQVEHQGDPAAFWGAVRATFGETAGRRLQLDGQLGYLTLNNAPLIERLHATAGETPLADPVELIERGYHRPEKWLPLIDGVPPEIPGTDELARGTNYAEVLATQLCVSYPTATVAAMVKSGETPTTAAPVDQVHEFLLHNQHSFDIGMQPVEQYVARNQIQIDAGVQREIARIQRVRQITPGDDAMNALLKKGLDSAFAVAQYERSEFVAAFANEVGGETQASLIHARAQQVHAAVLNVATSYVLASNAPGIGVHSTAQILNSTPNTPAKAGDVIAYPTLKTLLGDMDYCDCKECRSVLSPAAYLVDLLQFLDRDKVRWGQFLTQWQKDHHGAPYPFADMSAWDAAGHPSDTTITPLDVLLSRRPDLQHLPLTCENTNTPLPYIDLVNETLEQFVAHGLTLEGFQGHTTDDGATPEELLANPQFVQDAAYGILAGKGTPVPLLPPTPPLPFNQPLERLRRLFAAFEAPLPRVMEALHKDDAVERASDADYGWRDIWMEQLGLSRAEYALLTDHTPTLRQLCGFPATTSDDAALAALSNAKDFCRRLAISYDDLLELLRTRFINPNGALIPKLERLGVPLKTLKALKDGAITDQQFDDAIAPQIDAAEYGGDIKAWVKHQANYDKIMGLLVLADPTGANNASSFDALEFRYADPARLADRVSPFEFVRLLRFIRLWKKLGWSIEQTDKAINALYPSEQAPDSTDDTVNLRKLDAGFLTLLPRLGALARVIERLNLKVTSDLLPLLACFAPIDTYGTGSLYGALFLNPALLEQDPVFADDGYGNVLTDSRQKDGDQQPSRSAKLLLDYQEALRPALTLTRDEFESIVKALRFNAETTLTVENVSAVFRRGWLARKLKLSVRELLLLITYSGIDPFAAIGPANPAILDLLDLVDRLRTAGLKPAQALYLIWNEDLSGTSAPASGQINEFVRSLRAGLAAVEDEFCIADDPDGQIARARMALVYDNTATDLFFGLLNNTLVSDTHYDTPYSHPQPTLDQPIQDAAPGQISYDDFRKRLTFVGAMTTLTRDRLKAVDGTTAAFKAAIDELYTENQRLVQKIVKPFFARYPELQTLYEAYAASTDPPERKRSRLLANFLPTLKRRRKRQQALQVISAAAKTDVAFATAVLDAVAVLHAVADTTLPALDDLVAVEQPGLAATFYFRDTATGDAAFPSNAEATLDYRPVGEHSLPANGGNPVSGIWSGYIEAPTDGFYNIRVDADAGATVTLTVGDTTQDGNQWRNASPIELRAGTLYAFTLTVENVRDTLSVRWQTTGRDWEVIPSRCLYSATLRDHLLQAYTRFFKAASLADALKLTARECAHLAADADHQIGGQGWFNALPITGQPDGSTSKALCAALEALLDFASTKAALSPADERLLAVLTDPQAAVKPDGLLFTLTRWDAVSLKTLLDRFGATSTDLAHVATFQRVYAAFEQLTALGVGANPLIEVTTNEPTADAVRNLQGALRARHAPSDWLSVVKPINDDLRGRQRDALVAYVLHQMCSNPASAHIDTADKLFEYFLMDVQMEPCMQTSRIRNALSTTQLFIERCLMNLEPRVASSAMNAAQWEWMQRYRMWEANRKVFLWPENWLEPELRDDQSPFFKELMSELLQSDITEDRAATALGNYLVKLDTVAKLEPCGIHFVEHDPGTADDIAYVVARTAGVGHAYYWRRCEYGYWTPWEQIKLDIEDTPVIPVLWKSRLFLFWLRILRQPDLAPPKPFAVNKDKNLTQLQTNEIKTDPPHLTVQALLCWSEYYNGTWQPTKTSDSSRPTTLGSFAPLDFDRTALRLSASIEGDALRIGIDGQGESSFLLFNTHSLPVREEDLPTSLLFPVGPQRYLSVSNGMLTADYTRRLTIDMGFDDSSPLHRPVLKIKNPVGSWTVEPNHDLANPWDAPFFYSDNHHVFYVSTGQQPVTLTTWQGYGDKTLNPRVSVQHIPPIVILQAPGPVVPDRIGPVSSGLNVGISNPAPVERFVTEDAYISRGLGTVGTVKFGTTELGPAGAQAKQRG
ncbi:neuraminidase-like domain-containing protein [Streptomyces sp. NPDC057717]|uniref:neuraminidase-like domain-containing protein n=1 Tax=Streptomyces sp. NPDC057717 TaxID=3346224 RepID=UPI0036CCE9E0